MFEISLYGVIFTILYCTVLCTLLCPEVLKKPFDLNVVVSIRFRIRSRVDRRPIRFNAVPSRRSNVTLVR